MGRKRVHDESLRVKLLDRAGELLSTDGVAALSLRTLASDVGTSTTAVYSLFGGKPALLRALYAEGFRVLAAHLARVRPTDDPAEDVVALGMAYRTSALDAPNYYRVMFESLRPEIDDHERRSSRETFLPLLDAVERCVEKKIFRDVCPASVATMLWAYVHGLVSLELSGLLPAQAGEPQSLLEASLRRAITGWHRIGQKEGESGSPA